MADSFDVALSKLSASVPVPLFFDSRVFGKVSFFHELLVRAGSAFVDGRGFRYVRFGPVVAGPFRQGVFSGDDELADAWKLLPLFSDVVESRIVSFVEASLFFSGELSSVVSERVRLSLLLELSNHIGHLSDVDAVLRSVVNFLVSKLRASNVVVDAFDRNISYFDGAQYVPIMKRLFSHVADSKSSVIVRDVSSDVLLKGVDVSRLPSCVCVFPLLLNRVFSGCFFVFSDVVPVLIDVVPDILREVSRVLQRVSEFERVQVSARTDVLTGMHNRVELISSLNELLPRLSAEKAPVSLLLFDVDNFKRFNDSQGHPAGDRVLKVIAQTAMSVVSDSGVCCRYGGEEFVVVLPRADQNEACRIAESLRSAIESASPLTVSIGLITCLNSSASRDQLIAEADRALYKAKRLGKNRVVPFVMVDKNLGVIDTLEV